MSGRPTEHPTGRPTGLQVRDMALADCDRVAEIRVGGWRSAYRGLMPQPYLDAMSVPKDAERRRARLLQGDGSVVNIVAERDGEIVGWACHGPYRDGEVPAGGVELYAIYVDPDGQGAGAGRALLDESVRRCVAAGYGRMYLWVLEGNAHARHFYERSGFQADGTEEPFEVDGVEVPEVRYARDLTVRPDVSAASECAPAPPPPPPRGPGGRARR